MLLKSLAGVAIAACLTGVNAVTVPGLDSLSKQAAELVRRDSFLEPVYDTLTAADSDFITFHLKNLTSLTTNSSKCNSCKTRVKFAKNLLEENPDKSHLISLLVYKQCLQANNNSDTKCNLKDFFITTNEKHFFDIDSEGQKFAATGTSAVNFWDNDFLHMLQNFNTSSDLDLTYYCYYKWSSCNLPETPDVNEMFGVNEWYPEKKEEYNSPPNYTNNSDTFNVLHISDFHIQLRYTLGSESNCSVTPCCLPESYNSKLTTKNYNFTTAFENSGADLNEIDIAFYPDAHYDDNDVFVPGSYYNFPKYRGWSYVSQPATTWGGYKCDSPEVLLNNTMSYIKLAHGDKEFEFTIFTGDLVDHDKIHCSPDATKEAETKCFSIMKHYLGDIPVLASLGNHDTFPYGQLSPIDYEFNNSYNWDSDLINQIYLDNKWMNDNVSIESLRSHYSGFAYESKRGLKVISLNSNAYYQKNLWSYINLSTNADAFGQWEFLINELVESESKGQRVWLMAHIPSGDFDALPIQSKIFAQIVERFSPYTIANVFFGHTHQDEFKILYSTNSSKEIEDVINMAWIVQSVTPLANYNPSWRYYEVENESFNIINSYSYYTQLNETFVDGALEPKWLFEYSLRDTYDPEHSWPTDAPLNSTFFHKYLMENLKNQTDISFNQKYTDIRFRHSPFIDDCSNGTVVSDDCYNSNWCATSNFLSDEYINCQR